MKGDICKVDGCGKIIRAKDGLACASCKMIKHRTGKYPTNFCNKLTTKLRFYEGVMLPNDNGCMIWTKLRTKKGYGAMKIRGKSVAIHRFSYALHYGDFDATLHVCHKCDNPSCVAPEHLFLGTNADNVKDKVVKGRVYYPSPKFGEKNNSAKLSNKDVLDIRRLLTDGMQVNHIAAKYNVGRRTISDIKNNRRWTHIGEI